MSNRRIVSVFLRCLALLALAALFLLPAQRASTKPQANITVVGYWKYLDRSSAIVPANTFLVELLSGTGGHLAWGYTDTNGRFSLGPLVYSRGMQIKVKIRTAWVNWWSGVGDTRGLFLHAASGEVVYFRCRAVDRVGNAAGWPASADAWTTAGADASGLTEVRFPVVARQ